MTHDPKLVDELLAAVVLRMKATTINSNDDALMAIMRAREALRPAPPKPREWWLSINGHGNHHCYESYDDAALWTIKFAAPIHVREVLDK